MKFYIWWNKSHDESDEPYILKITKLNPKNLEIKKVKEPNDNHLCSYNGYRNEKKDYDKDGELIPKIYQMNLKGKFSQIYTLIYHEEGQGGDWINDINIYIFTDLDEMKNFVDDVYNQDHYDECEKCEKYCYFDGKCGRKFVKKLIRKKKVIYGNDRGECSMQWFCKDIC